MAISSDKANVTIEFQWESDTDDTNLNVKYHVLNGIPTVSVESEDETAWFNFPALFFTEVTQFIVSQKIISNTSSKQSKSIRTTVLPQSDGSAAVLLDDPPVDLEPDPSPAANVLPVPNIQRKSDENGNLEPILDIADMNPLESLGGIESIVTKPKTKSKSTRKKPPVEKYDRPVIRGANEETSKALRGQGDQSKSIKSNHTT
jgi:hypothetical protein